MMTASGVVAATMPFFLLPIIKAYGWRQGYLALGLLPLLVIPFALAFLRREPKRAGGGASEGYIGLTLAEAARTRQFWGIFVGILLATAACTALATNIVDLLTTRGADQATVKVAASTFGIAGIAGRLLTGICLDRLPGPLCGAVVMVFSTAGVLLFEAHGHPLILIAAVASMGLVAGAEADLVGYLAGRYFGLRSYAEVYGALYSAAAFGASGGVVLVGLVVRLTGAYEPFLIIAAAFSAVSIVLFATLGRYPAAFAPGATPLLDPPLKD
jgi:predicted MFS family arabinose efflux permease